MVRKQCARAAASLCVVISTLLPQSVFAEGSSTLRAYADVLHGQAEVWHGFGGYLNGQGNYMRGYAEVIRARGEYIRMVAEARLAWAQAGLVDAQAAGKWEEVRQYRLMIDRLQRELRNLMRNERLINRRISDIETHSRRLNNVVTGRVSSWTFRSMQVMTMRYVPLKVTNEIMTVEFPELEADNFIPNRPDDESEVFPGGNYGQLWHFLEKKNYSLAPWGKAHIGIMLGLQEFDEAAELEVEKYLEHLANLRAGLYNVWSPPGVPPQEPGL